MPEAFMPAPTNPWMNLLILLDSLHNLREHSVRLESDELLLSDINAAVERGYFRPEEEKRLKDWFIRFLTIREGYWEIIDEVTVNLQEDINLISTLSEWRQLIIGYVAASLLVRMDHFLIDKVATDKLTQRKLNERYINHRVERKQYTRLFNALTDPGNALLLLRVKVFLQTHQEQVNTLKDDACVGELVRSLPEFTQYIDYGKRRYLKRRIRYRWHSFRRRFAMAKQNVSFLFLEHSGRVLSDIGDHRRKKRVTEKIHQQLETLLQPGDVIVTRHERVATNLFLPGYWPHCALFVGSEQQREAMDITIDNERKQRWSGDRSVLEALKDGVLFRPLSETLAVDAVTILRPALPVESIARCIEKACENEGKGYNFDFDFFRSDKLVCTEVVYRAYDGVEPIHFSLEKRAGRPTLSAEDILDMALEQKMFRVVAVFGAPRCRRKIALPDRALNVLKRSYQAKPQI